MWAKMSESAAFAAAAFFSASFSAELVRMNPTVTAAANARIAVSASRLKAATAGLRCAHRRSRRNADVSAAETGS